MNETSLVLCFSTFAKIEEFTMMKIERYPATTNRSLQAWNAADELMVQYYEELDIKKTNCSIYHDQFGYLTCHLAEQKPRVIINLNSQQKAIEKNIEKLKLPFSSEQFKNPLEPIDKPIEVVLMKMPKSLDLFELYLQQIHQSVKEDALVIIGFMTRNFTKQSLQIAAHYFEELEQSKAKKKARLLILRKPKPNFEKELIREVKLDEKKSLKQYYGVFSANHIDYATQFLLEHIELKEDEDKMLDVGCGNGIIAHQARELNPALEIHLTEDHYLALESAKLNLGDSSSTHYHFSDELSHFESEYFPLVVSNPPFHFEYENNIEITLSLFGEIQRILKSDGRFLMVANRHLNYASHLSKLFMKVEVKAENDRFVVYECLK
ncbi:methyltransferase [Lentimicrobium sp. L6]|nr:methyltransferase [Lentimicrobium sp. L6]